MKPKIIDCLPRKSPIGALSSLKTDVKDTLVGAINWLYDYFKEKLGAKDISTIGDGTLTGAISYLNSNSADLEDINSRITSNENSIKLLQSSKADKTSIDGIKEKVDSNSEEISSLKNSVSNGKKLVANAITEKGIETATNASFQTMADNIGKISSGGSDDDPATTSYNMRIITAPYGTAINAFKSMDVTGKYDSLCTTYNTFIKELNMNVKITTTQDFQKIEKSVQEAG